MKLAILFLWESRYKSEISLSELNSAHNHAFLYGYIAFSPEIYSASLPIPILHSSLWWEIFRSQSLRPTVSTMQGTIKNLGPTGWFPCRIKRLKCESIWLERKANFLLIVTFSPWLCEEVWREWVVEVGESVGAHLSAADGDGVAKELQKRWLMKLLRKIINFAWSLVHKVCTVLAAQSTRCTPFSTFIHKDLKFDNCCWDSIPGTET